MRHEDPAHPSSLQARADRLVRVRRMTGLARHVFGEFPGLNADCIYRWEKLKRGGLTRKGAEKVILRLAELGVVCSYQWLIDGIGTEPFYDQSISTPSTVPSVSEEELQIGEELAVFRNNANSFDWIVKDEAMMPEYRIGDYVAGIKLKDVSRAIGQTCLVQTHTGEILLRIVQAGAVRNEYTLLATNPQPNIPALLHNIALKMAAPILWRRRKRIQ